jgi:hypothetical protein
MLKSLAHALNSSDLEQHEHDCAIDKIHAMGVAAIDCPLGILTIRFIDGRQPMCYIPLIELLMKTVSIQFKCSHEMLSKLCEQAVKEAVFPYCRTCHGRGESWDDVSQHVIQCPTCHGSGTHRYSDPERAQVFGVDGDYEQWGRRFHMVQRIFTDNYHLAQRQSIYILRDE